MNLNRMLEQIDMENHARRDLLNEAFASVSSDDLVAMHTTAHAMKHEAMLLFKESGENPDTGFVFETDIHTATLMILAMQHYCGQHLAKRLRDRQQQEETQ